MRLFWSVLLAWALLLGGSSTSALVLGRRLPRLSAVRASSPSQPAAPGDSYATPRVGGSGDGGHVRQVMRLGLLGVGLLAGKRVSKAAAPPALCSSTASLQDVVYPPVSKELADLVVVTKPRDERTYKALTLRNDMRVLLVSDPNSSRSAAALDVHVGSFSDPDDVPGLAHFCEHMSFLGTKKFPKEEEFTSYLASHGGSSNAYTDNEDTVYYFDVNAEFLSDSLERFSQFFISPLFTESATARELNAIDSEHAKNINSDSFRLYQLEKGFANPAHPFHKFATGNKQTLETDTAAKGIDIRQALLDFHSAHYSANQMTLCVVGKESLAQLEKLTTRFFSDVPNKKVAAPAKEWWGKIDVYPQQHAASLLEIVPVSEIRRLTLTWPVPVSSPEARDVLAAIKPEMVVSHLLGHEGKGSLRSLLTAKGWANGVQAAPSSEVSDMQLFEVGVELTEEGMRHRDDIVEMVFAYIQLISSGIPDYIYTEVETLSRIAFNFSEKNDPAEFASSIVSDMQQHRRPSQYLTGSHLFDFYPAVTQCEVGRYLSQLTPQRLQLKVISRDFEGRTNAVGEWYSTNYNSVPALEAETRRWAAVNAAKQYPALALPVPNDLIPTSFDLVANSPEKELSQAAKEKELAAPPKLIRDDGAWTVWHKTDRSFLQPRTYTIISLAVPAEKYDAAFVVKSRLFSNCFLDSINEFLYDARLAGVVFELEFTSKGVQLQIGGFSDKLESFTQKVLQALASFRPDQGTFARFKDLQRRGLAGWKTQQPYSHVAYYASLATESLQYPISELEAALERLTVRDLTSFLPDVLRSSAGTALVVGNTDAPGALAIVGAVERTFPFATLDPKSRSRRFVSELPVSSAEQGGILLRHQEPNPQDENSAVTFYFQLPTRDLRETIVLEVLAEAIEQGFYNTLRTQEQLGYIVFSGIRHREGIFMLALTVQSNVLDGPGLTRRVERYLAESAVPELTALPAEEFEAFKEGIRVRKLEPDQRLTSQASRLWSEVVNAAIEPPLFDRYAREVAVLDSLGQAEFNQFVRDFLGQGGVGARRRLLVSEVTAVGRAGKEGGGGGGGGEGVPLARVEDEMAFQRNLPLL